MSTTDDIPVAVAGPTLVIPQAAEFEDDLETLSYRNQSSVALAVLTALNVAGVQFVRFAALDVSNNLRCKLVPLDRLLADPSKFYSGVGIAEVVLGGLTSREDVPVKGWGDSPARLLSLIPDISSLRILSCNKTTAMVLGTLQQPSADDNLKFSSSPLCTRHLLKRVVQTAEKAFGLAFTVGVEIEFCLFRSDDDSPVDSSLYGTTTTINEQSSFISDLYEQLKLQSIEVEQIHSESAPGQVEVVLGRVKDDVVRMADNVVFAHETIQNCAKMHKLRAVFLPKVFADQAGNGMHLHMSFRELSDNARHKDQINSFLRASVAGQISRKGRSFVEGILQHLAALLCVTIPKANSFRRVGPGCWTGHSIGWDIEDKESPLRVCMDGVTGEPTNVELKLSDNTSNVYLSLALVLSAGLDGIKKHLTLRPSIGLAGPGAPLPATLQESADLLSKDQLLLRVMGPELSQAYIAVTRKEAEGVNDALESEVWRALKRA
mmetsp:Transcript_1501/g.2333  ORF Transcript_1501/g.2333 Transcript_1501/m.2333 type:complete len:491 (+) Transcript_1501:162-1634(+)|eukprot:CAMPEP_0172417886 /NCGR_PEP_ID=MMETSP1064-20121228/4364_1 /TAXON_ID=202472 /ORGANISM="Aulacoseira subarctica , Strain CCAP 1002/5" /LENGTH=490 /DNA_ID=CAMNT_0013156445 /DNA_START=149 /DNA_END=1621 /DNA_ORIENTATION=+